jgi:hypothetical protein
VQSETTTSPAAAAKPGRRRDGRPKLHSIAATANQAKHAATSTHHRCVGGACRGKNIGGENVRAIVVNVTVAVAAFEPSKVTVCGETVQLAAVGAPVQVQVTV